MTKFRNKYRSESHRWQFWDYSAPAAYYITSITNDRINRFGKVVGGNMILSDEGKILDFHFHELFKNNDNIILDEYIIMPNHFHSVLIIPDDDSVYPEKNNVNKTDDFVLLKTVDTIHELYLRGIKQSKSFFTNHDFSGLSEQAKIAKYKKLRRKMLIPKIIGKLKMQVSKHINIKNNTPDATNWQHDFYDEVIKFSDDFFKIKIYIKSNPDNWKTDRLK